MQAAGMRVSGVMKAGHRRTGETTSAQSLVGRGQHGARCVRQRPGDRCQRIAGPVAPLAIQHAIAEVRVMREFELLARDGIDRADVDRQAGGLIRAWARGREGGWGVGGW